MSQKQNDIVAEQQSFMEYAEMVRSLFFYSKYRYC